MANREQPKLSERDWPEIRKAKASGKSGWFYFTSLVKLLIQEIGEDKTGDILRKHMRLLAQKFVVPSMKSFGIQGNGPWELASYFKLATGDILGYKMELIEEAPNKVRCRYYPPCVWFPDLDIPVSYCQAEGEFELEAARIINPKIKISFPTYMTRGDPYCEVVYEEAD